MAHRTIVFNVPCELFDRFKQKLVENRTTQTYWGIDAITHYVNGNKLTRKKTSKPNKS